MPASQMLELKLDTAERVGDRLAQPGELSGEDFLTLLDVNARELIPLGEVQFQRLLNAVSPRLSESQLETAFRYAERGMIYYIDYSYQPDEARDFFAMAFALSEERNLRTGYTPFDFHLGEPARISRVDEALQHGVMSGQSVLELLEMRAEPPQPIPSYHLERMLEAAELAGEKRVSLYQIDLIVRHTLQGASHHLAAGTLKSAELFFEMCLKTLEWEAWRNKVEAQQRNFAS